MNVRRTIQLACVLVTGSAGVASVAQAPIGIAAIFFCAALLVAVLPFGQAVSEDHLRLLDDDLRVLREQRNPGSQVKCCVGKNIGSLPNAVASGIRPEQFRLAWRQHAGQILQPTQTVARSEPAHHGGRQQDDR